MLKKATAELNAEQTESYRRAGYVVVPDLLTEAEVQSFLAHIDSGLRVASYGLHGHLADSRYRAIATHAKIAGAAQQLLGGRPRVVQTMLLDKPPVVGKGIALHQDSHYLPRDETTPDTLMACWLALTDADSDNGGLCVVPGSQQDGLRSVHRAEKSVEHDDFEAEYDMRDQAGHRWKQAMYRFEIDDLNPNSIAHLKVPRGGGVFFSGLTIHGSFGNHSPNRARRAFAVHYVREDTHMLREDIQNTMEVLL